MQAGSVLVWVCSSGRLLTGAMGGGGVTSGLEMVQAITGPFFI